MNLTLKKTTVLLLPMLLLFAFNHVAEARWREDAKFGYKIDIPDGWKTQKMDQDPGRMMIALSPDESIAVSVTSVPVKRTLTSKDMVDSFEQGLLTNILSSGKAIKRSTHTINGLTGSYVVYKGVYDGTSGKIKVTVHAFYTAWEKTGYLLWWLVPNKLLGQHQEQAQKTFDSFVVPKAKTVSKIIPPIKVKPPPMPKSKAPSWSASKINKQAFKPEPQIDTQAIDCTKAKQAWAQTVRAYYHAKQQNKKESVITSKQREMMQAQQTFSECEISSDGKSNP